MFISNNRASFHFWWKNNLIKLQEVSKHYENNCVLQKPFFLFRHLRFSISFILSFDQSHNLDECHPTGNNSFFFFIPCILYNHCIPRQHPKTLRTQHVSSRYTAFTVVLSNNPAQVSACKSLYVLPRHTSLGSGAYQKHIPEIMDIFHRLVVHFLGN